MTRNQFATIAERDAFVVRSSDIGDRFFVRETGKTYEATAPGAGASNWSSIADLSTSAALTAAVLAAQLYMPISGLAMTWASATTITVATGACPDSTKAAYIENTSAKTLDTSSGGALGIDTGAIAAAKLYYLWLLKGTSGVTVVASLQSVFASVTKPAGYAAYGRCVGTFHTKAASANVPKFTQSTAGNRRDYFTYELDASQNVVVNGAATSFTDLDCSKVLSVFATRAVVQLNSLTGALTAGSGGYLSVGTLAQLYTAAFYNADAPSPGYGGQSTVPVLVGTPSAAIAYRVYTSAGATPTLTVAVLGYSEDL